MFVSWLRGNGVSAASAHGRASRCPAPSGARTHRYQPALETLEERCVLSSPPSGFGILPAVSAGLTADQANRADAVVNWNATMLRAIWTAHTAPTLASRVLAMVGTAVYDAVDAIHPTYALYPVPGLNGRPAANASPEAAAIAAANTVLTSLYPAQAALFADAYATTLGRVPDGPAKLTGLSWGQRVAKAVLAWRAADDVRSQVTPAEYTPAPPGGTPGAYELTPGTTFALTPQWGQETPWAMTSAAQFLPPPPPALDSAQYAADFNRTKDYGGVVSSVRTADQTQFAHFWADLPSSSVTPPGHWNEIAEHLSLQKGLTLEQNAHLFGLLNLGMTDAAINCWDAKYVYDLWRPVTAINDPRAHDLNAATTSDPNWAPLWSTPNFPSYTSGHSTFSGAADAILTAVFAPNTAFTIGSDDLPGITRSFTSFTQAADEAGESRVMGGIHFEFDNSAGLRAGRQIGNYILQNFLFARNKVSASLEVNPNSPGQFILFISGSEGKDLITVNKVGQQLFVMANGQILGPFASSQINLITVNARGGNDVVAVSQLVRTDTELHGGAGNDLLIGGGGSNRIFGEDGNDILVGFAVHDLLDGGPGHNRLFRI